VGLCRIVSTDLSAELLGIVNEIVTAFDVTSMSRYLDIAGALSKGINRLFGMKDVQLRLGVRDEFKEGEPNPLRPGYFAYVNCNDDELQSNNLWVKEGSLHIGDRESSLKRVSQYDYCLVKVQRLKDRSDISTLPFSKVWEEAKNLVWQGDQRRARTRMLELNQKLATSKDLARLHRYHLLALFKANFELESEIFENSIRAGPRGPSATRGTADMPERGRGRIQEALQIMDSAQVSVEIKRSLGGIAANWGAFARLRGTSKTFEWNQQFISSELALLRDIGSDPQHPDPQALADAIALASLKT
jgi:hypothetical protein